MFDFQKATLPQLEKEYRKTARSARIWSRINCVNATPLYDRLKRIDVEITRRQAEKASV
jgi:hypothetical protein